VRKDSWDPFDMSPRESVWQSLFIGLTWSILAWSLFMLLIVSVILLSR
jgi:hypothetical protein